MKLRRRYINLKNENIKFLSFDKKIHFSVPQFILKFSIDFKILNQF